MEWVGYWDDLISRVTGITERTRMTEKTGMTRITMMGG